MQGARRADSCTPPASAISARTAPKRACASPPRSASGNLIAGREQDGSILIRAACCGWSAAINASAEAALAKLSVQYGAPERRRAQPVGRQPAAGSRFAREFARQPKLLVAAQPTRGVDIAGIAFIHAELVRYRDRGGAVLLISEELDEILALSDRIVGLYGGKITGQLSRAEASAESVGRLMLGQKAAGDGRRCRRYGARANSWSRLSPWRR